LLGVWHLSLLRIGAVESMLTLTQNLIENDDQTSRDFSVDTGGVLVDRWNSLRLGGCN